MRKYNIRVSQLEPGFFLACICFTFWQTGTSKNDPNRLLAAPVCSLPVDVQTTIAGLLRYWRKPKKREDSQAGSGVVRSAFFLWFLGRFMTLFAVNIVYNSIHHVCVFRVVSYDSICHFCTSQFENLWTWWWRLKFSSCYIIFYSMCIYFYTYIFNIWKVTALKEAWLIC